MISSNNSTIEYIPFQTLPKAKAYKILNYGRTYDKYTRFRLSENSELITDIYVDDEPYTIFTHDGSSNKVIKLNDESQIPHNVEIHYSGVHNPSIKSCILTNAEIDLLVAKYGCKL